MIIVIVKVVVKRVGQLFAAAMSRSCLMVLGRKLSLYSEVRHLGTTKGKLLVLVDVRYRLMVIAWLLSLRILLRMFWHVASMKSVV